VFISARVKWLRIGVDALILNFQRKSDDHDESVLLCDFSIPSENILLKEPLFREVHRRRMALFVVTSTRQARLLYRTRSLKFSRPFTDLLLYFGKYFTSNVEQLFCSWGQFYFLI
jgi:hypothetical protein